MKLDYKFQELVFLEDDANIFKMIGPVLVKQDLPEAKNTVNKRIEYINGEMWVWSSDYQSKKWDSATAIYLQSSV